MHNFMTERESTYYVYYSFVIPYYRNQNFVGIITVIVGHGIRLSVNDHRVA